MNPPENETSQTQVNDADNASASTSRTTRRDIVNQIAGLMSKNLSSGELAELRRISPEEPFTPALWKILISCVPESWTSGADRDEKERRWAALLMGMALSGGLHTPSKPFGEALAEAGWSELRFVRLMRAKDKKLFGELRRVAGYLAAKSQEANWADMADLLLDQHGDFAEKHRRRLARYYYRKLYTLEQQS